jgi:protein involved in polysaccharide export with SLBB domain
MTGISASDGRSRNSSWSGRVVAVCVPLVAAGVLWLAGHQPAVAQSSGAAAVDAGASGGPIRLRQPSADQAGQRDAQRQGRSESESGAGDGPRPLARPARPGDFELFVRRLAGSSGIDADPIRRLGAELVTDWTAGDSPDGLPKVPADYSVSVGDELHVTIWGSVDADLRLVVDRSGQVSIPRVGTISVAGVRFSDLNALFTQRVGQVFKNFQLNTTLGRIRQVRVYVTGFADKPGAYQVSGLSTIVNALVRAGGPSAAGSFRNIQLRRGGKVVTTYDLYDLIVKGDTAADRPLQAEDVIHVNAVGTQVGLIGSVNRPGVFELKDGETINELMAMAGGMTAVADRTRLAIERLDDRNDIRIVQVALPSGFGSRLNSGDVLRVFSAVEATLPVERQNKRVRIEGEVAKPGEYVLPAGSGVEDAIRAAGGMTSAAFVFGAEFNRESVRVKQQENYERALRDLETELARAASTQRTSNADEAAAANARGASTNRLVDRLRSLKPSGRIVLQLEPGTKSLPNLALEDGDRIYIPAIPTTVGVFGSVFNGGSYLHGSGRKLGDFLRLAGGPTRGADSDSVFVIRANGSVISNRQRETGWFGRGDQALTELGALPGDTVFVPEEMDKTTFVQKLKDWTQILSQFGLGLAAIKTLGN